MGVAQLVEHLVVAQVAVGSSPITHPIKMEAFAERPFLFNFESDAEIGQKGALCEGLNCGPLRRPAPQWSLF